MAGAFVGHVQHHASGMVRFLRSAQPPVPAAAFGQKDEQRIGDRIARLGGAKAVPGMAALAGHTTLGKK
jgi:hypothetical protein